MFSVPTTPNRNFPIQHWKVRYGRPPHVPRDGGYLPHHDKGKGAAHNWQFGIARPPPPLLVAAMRVYPADGLGRHHSDRLIAGHPALAAAPLSAQNSWWVALFPQQV